jgi:hypothetical protein
MLSTIQGHPEQAGRPLIATTAVTTSAPLRTGTLPVEAGCRASSPDEAAQDVNVNYGKFVNPRDTCGSDGNTH